MLRTALIMLGAVSPAACDRYRDNIKAYVQCYGAQCWTVIYQADVRVRRELVVRVKRKGAQQKAAANRAGAHHPL